MQNQMITLQSAMILLWVLSPSQLPAAEAPPVYLEIATEAGLSLEAPSQWLRALKDLPLESLRIRTARAGDAPRVESRGRETTTSYHVLGVLRTDNRLYLPGGKFRLQDKAALRGWLGKLATGQQSDGDHRTQSFGLSERALVDVFDRLALPVRRPTKDQLVSRVVAQIRSDLTLPMEIDPAVTARLRSDERVADELSGLSSGTALAAALRPLGLALVPTDAGGRVQLRVTSGRKVRQAWPVGWSPETNPREALPKLFEFLQVEIAKTPLNQALEAIQGRLEVPFLLDHNALASRQIDPAKIEVRFPAKRSFYKRILDRVLYQAGLESRLRVDEAQQPFIWITTIRPLKRD
jgi:hypothetical protein